MTMQASMQKPAVLIVGAGASGVILALTLAKNGVPIRIIEKDLSFHVGQRGPAIQPRSLEVFNFLGVLSDVTNNSMEVPLRRAYKMPEGTEPAATFHLTGPPQEATPAIPFPNARMMGQAHLEELIRVHLATLGVHVELGKELIGFKQDESGVVATILNKGLSEGQKETIEADYIVSAEGGKSIVRKQLGLLFMGETRDNLRFLITDMHVKGLSDDYWHSWGDLGEKAVWMRPTEYPGLFNVIVSSVPGTVDNDLLMSSREALIEFIYDMTNRRELEFGEFEWQTVWRPNIRMVDKFSSGRAFLIGDAAHIHTPAGGQGMNTGMQDGFNLGWKLAMVHKGLASPSLLDSYSEERLPVAKAVLVQSTAFLEKQQAFRASKPDVSMVSASAVFRQLGVNYRWSSIVVDEQVGDNTGEELAAYLPSGSGMLRAGDRAPEASGLLQYAPGRVSQSSISLFSIFKPTHHTVLLFYPTVEHAQRAIGLLPKTAREAFRFVVILSSELAATFPTDTLASVDYMLLDAQGHTSAAYRPVKSGFKTIAVRPDGVIGAIVKTFEGFEKYLTMFSGHT